ncbi:MAG: bifunctional riboflavin kinase/FAD synthetase [Terriglobia bacterium]
MELVCDLEKLPPPASGSVVTIGNFDGVHLAHQQLLKRVAERAGARGAKAIAVTFDPHPIRVLAPDRAPAALTSISERASLLERLGIDILVVLHFTREVAHLSPEAFVRQALVERLHVAGVCAGPNFRFGYRQAGDAALLAELGRAEGFSVEILPALSVRGQMVSSTRIRQLLSEGKVHLAGRLLGRPFANCGPVASGRGIGRREAVPTLNLAPIEEQLPKTGVYVTRTRLGGESRPSVTNVGFSPTFGEHDLTVETHLLNFAGTVDAKEIAVEYLHRLRDEVKFHNPAMLRLQIQEDVQRSLKFFRLLEELHRREEPV